METLFQEQLVQNLLIVISIGAGVYFINYFLSSQNISLNEYLHNRVKTHVGTFIFIVIASTCAAEAIIAGTVELAVTDKGVNFVGRMISHSAISLLSIVMLIEMSNRSAMFIGHITSIREVKRKPINWIRQLMINTIVLSACLWGTVYMPYINYSSVVQAYDESYYGMILFKQYVFFWQNWEPVIQAIGQELISKGLHDPKIPFTLEDHLSHGTMVSAQVIRVHMYALVVDVVLAIERFYSNSTDSTDKVKNPRSLFKWVLDNITNLDSAGVNGRLRKVLDVYENDLSSAHRARLIKYFHDFKEDFLSASDTDAKFNLIEELNDFVKSSPSSGGLGFTFPNKRKRDL